MEYMTIWEASEKWKLSQQQVQNLCVLGLVEGAVRAGRAWMIPKNAEKPIFNKPRRINKKDENIPLPLTSSTSSFFHIFDLYTTPGTADKVIQSLADRPEAQTLFATAIAYSRGAMNLACDYAKRLMSLGSGFYSTNASSLLLALVAIWKGDISLYQEAKGHICGALWKTIEEKQILELLLACIDSMLQAPSIVIYPEWFRHGQFEHLSPDFFPYAYILYIKFLVIAAQYSEEGATFLEVSEMDRMRIIPYIVEPLLVRTVADKNVIPEIYLRLLVASIYHQLGVDEHAIVHVDKVIELALPDNLLGILVEQRRYLSDLLDKRLFIINPEAYEKYKELHAGFFEGWSKLYNALFP